MVTPFTHEAQTGPRHAQTVGRWLPGGGRVPADGQRLPFWGARNPLKWRMGTAAQPCAWVTLKAAHCPFRGM